MRNTALGAFLLVALTLISPALAREIETLEYNGWRGVAVADEQNSFVGCYVAANFPNGIRFYITMFPNGATSLRFYNPAWNLEAGAPINGSLRIDNRYFSSFAGTAVDAQLISMTFVTGDPVFQSLRLGRMLSVTSPLGASQYDLTDTARALDLVQNCVERYKGFAVQDPAVQQWLADNPWYNNPQFRAETERANAIIQQLTAEGIRIGAPNYFAELDGRLRAAGLNVGAGDAPASAATPSQAAPQEEPKFATGTGTGFVVSADGHVLTNHHVIRECVAPILLSAPGGERYEAIVIAGDEINDMALLRSDFRSAATASVRDTAVRAGEPVTVAGFPLAGYLASDLIITDGIVSALGGVGDDTRFLQISAPVQPGNSGGPLFDQNGNVIGIVSSGANARYVAETTGALPQNVNFAIKGSLVREFLEKNFVRFRANQNRFAIRTPEIASRARVFTVQVLCSVPVETPQN